MMNGTILMNIYIINLSLDYTYLRHQNISNLCFYKEMSRLMIRLLDILINKQLLGSINTQFSSDMMKIYTQNDFVFY